MATGLLNQYNVINANQQFAQKVQISIAAAAQAISSEATNTANHANRVALGKAVSNNTAAYALVFVVMLAAQGIEHSSTDTEINNMVAAVWNCIAGVP